MTRQTQHTPGPWTVEKGKFAGKFRVASQHFGAHHLCYLDKEEDARLIAAAPELKESNEEQQDILYRVIPFLEDLGELDTVYKNGAVAALIRKVKSAIEHSEQALAKAEGE